MAVNKKLIKDCGDYYKIEGMHPKGMKTNCCPFCDGRCSSGSWSPETCIACGAVYFFEAWTLDKKIG